MNELIIEPNKSAKRSWQELWSYRELFFFLAWRDILVRYKQTVIGIAWSILRPLLTMIVFSIVFNKIANLQSGDIPYPIFVFAAMLPWQFFSNTVSESSDSLITDANLISKVYFPRIIIPTTGMVVSLIDFIISFGILTLLMMWYKYLPGIQIIFLPAFLLLAILISLGIGYFISALNVKFRDFRYVIPFVVQFGLYISPVGFSSELIPSQWRLWYYLNPMSGVIDGFRWSIFGGQAELFIPGLILSVAVTLILFILGTNFFIKTERKFADII